MGRCPQAERAALSTKLAAFQSLSRAMERGVLPCHCGEGLAPASISSATHEACPYMHCAAPPPERVTHR